MTTESADHGWNLLMAGRIQEALAHFHKEHQRKPYYRTLSQLGFGYLYAGDLSKAQEYFDEYANLETPRLEDAYCWAGVVRWLQNNPVDACKVWTAGLDCDYRDDAGGMTLPLLLHFGAVRAPTAFRLEEAEALITDRLLSPRGPVFWPGPLGQFVLNHLTEEDLRLKALAAPNPWERQGQFAQVEFYAGVVALRDRDPASFLDRMAKCLAVEESPDIHERFLARHEVTR